MRLPSLPAFFANLVLAPRTIGAIAPSGPYLARLITSEITPGSGPILELGPGTGVFTQTLLDKGVGRADLTLVEIEKRFVSLLRRRFPGVAVLQRDARHLPDLEKGSYAAVVSGLPFRNMPKDTIFAIVSEALSLLRGDGSFYQFTYGAACSVPADVMDRLGLEAKRLGRVRLNLPPASVFKLSRKPS
jgi:phospholipid N-methyltransferase